MVHVIEAETVSFFILFNSHLSKGLKTYAKINPNIIAKNIGLIIKKANTKRTITNALVISCFINFSSIIF